MRRFIRFLITHGIAAAIGFALGIYLLPILTAPSGPDAAVLEQQAQNAEFSGEFTRERRGSDFLHWGEGKISLTADKIIHEGKLSPGPDYKLYLVPEYVEHEDEFNPLKDKSVRIGDVKTFDGAILDVPAGVNIADYSTVVIWCEAFGEFITSAKYN